MSPKSKRAALRKASESFRFHFLTQHLKSFQQEPLGLHWRKDTNKPASGYFDVDMPETGVTWISLITSKYLLFQPKEKLPGIKEVHYNFPLPFGIWFHRTITWENGEKTHSKIKTVSLFPNKYDIAEDYIAFRKRLLESI